MPESLPRREPMPWLPPLGELAHFERRRYFRVPGYAAPAVHLLRVWRAGHGHFAVITETGIGLSVTNSAHAVREALEEEWGTPLALAEHWPAEQSPESGEHVDLVLAPGPDGRAPLHPIGERAPHYEVCSAWWEVYGAQVLDVPADSPVLPPAR